MSYCDLSRSSSFLGIGRRWSSVVRRRRVAVDKFRRRVKDAFCGRERRNISTEISRRRHSKTRRLTFSSSSSYRQSISHSRQTLPLAELILHLVSSIHHSLRDPEPFQRDLDSLSDGGVGRKVEESNSLGLTETWRERSGVGGRGRLRGESIRPRSRNEGIGCRIEDHSFREILRTDNDLEGESSSWRGSDEWGERFGRKELACREGGSVGG